MAKIHGYIRASTAEQQYSYDAQIEAMRPQFRQWHENGGELGRVFKDCAVSGGTEIFERPAGKSLLKELRKGDRIVFAKLDRGFRNILDFSKFVQLMETMGVSYVACDLGIDSSSVMGSCIYSIMAAFAEMERKFISQRTKEGLAIKMRRRIPSEHHAPPGWRKLPNGSWDADYTERKLIDWMQRQHSRGRSFTAISKQLKEWGIRRACDTSYGREFVQIALFARANNDPGVSRWREDWLRKKAEALYGVSQESRHTSPGISQSSGQAS